MIIDHWPTLTCSTADFKICDIFIVGIATKWKLHLCLLLLNPKYCDNENWSNTSVLGMTNTSNMFLVQCWRLETSSKPFHQFFPCENHWKCYNKLASRSWPMLFTFTYFFLMHTLLFCCKIKSSCADLHKLCARLWPWM